MRDPASPFRMPPDTPTVIEIQGHGAIVNRDSSSIWQAGEDGSLIEIGSNIGTAAHVDLSDRAEARHRAIRWTTKNADQLPRPNRLAASRQADRYIGCALGVLALSRLHVEHHVAGIYAEQRHIVD